LYRLLYALVALIAAGAILFLVIRARSGKKSQPVETAAEHEKPSPTVSEYKREVKSVIDEYRKDVEAREMAKGCKDLALCAIAKVEDVADKPNHKDVKQYWQSMKIRLEAFRASYQGEPSYEYNCGGSRGVDTADALVEAILKHLHRRIAQA